MDASNIAKEILFKEGYGFPDRFIQDCALMIALSKIDQYRSECDYFEHKYTMKLENFESSLRQIKGEENFEKEEDIDDWEFAFNALKWWEHIGIENHIEPSYERNIEQVLTVISEKITV